MNQQANGKIITHVTMTEDKAGEQHAIEVPIVPDGREGTEVYVSPAKSGEEGGVMNTSKTAPLGSSEANLTLMHFQFSIMYDSLKIVLWFTALTS